MQTVPARGGFRPLHPGVFRAAPAFRSPPWHWHPTPGAPGCAGPPGPILALWHLGGSFAHEKEDSQPWGALEPQESCLEFRAQGTRTTSLVG